MVFGNGEVLFFHVSVNGGGGGEDDPRYSVFPAAFQDPHGAINVLEHIVLGIFDGAAHQGLPCQVDHAVEVFPAEEVFYPVIVDVHHFQPGLFGKVFPKSRGEVVQGNGFVPGVHELPDQMGSDESGTSCD